MDAYWFRSDSAAAILPWLAALAVVWLAGWLLVSQLFDLARRERALTGLAMGLIIFLWTANLIGRWLSPYATFVLAAFFVLAAGLLSAWSRGWRRLPWRDFLEWPPLLIALLAGWIFFRISQGVAILDEFVHIPLTSVIAAGEIPPRYFINADVRFAYHYGFHILSGSLMQLGGMFPWSAADLAKAIAWGLSMALAWLLGRRLSEQPWAGAAMAAALALAGGTRYLLLLVPAGLLLRMDPVIVFQGDEAAMGLPFSEMLAQYWRIDGGPPVALLFGFQSGIAEPYVIQQTGSSTLAMTIFLLVWLLAGRSRAAGAVLVFAILFAQWALTAESSYGMLAIGGAIAGAWMLLRSPSQWRRSMALIGLLGSAPIALLQGGLLTEIAAGLLAGGSSNLAAAVGVGLRSPPAILSKHLGALSLLSPLQIGIALFELGPVFLLSPWITGAAWREFRRSSWISGALILAAWAGFILPIFLRYQSGPDISRVTAFSMTIWTLMLVVLVFDQKYVRPRWLRPGMAAALVLSCFSGLMLAASLFTAVPGTVLSGEIGSLDARVSASLWDRLPPQSLVFDSIRGRAAALLARPNRAVIGNQAIGYQISPLWQQLVDEPDVDGFLEQGFDYLYLDQDWWQEMPAAGRESLSRPCVRRLVEFSEQDEFRRLLDLTGCRAGQR